MLPTLNNYVGLQGVEVSRFTMALQKASYRIVQIQPLSSMIVLVNKVESATLQTCRKLTLTTGIGADSGEL